jgi:hypothetical protein
VRFSNRRLRHPAFTQQLIAQPKQVSAHDPKSYSKTNQERIAMRAIASSTWLRLYGSCPIDPRGTQVIRHGLRSPLRTESEVLRVGQTRDEIEHPAA